MHPSPPLPGTRAPSWLAILALLSACGGQVAEPEPTPDACLPGHVPQVAHLLDEARGCFTRTSVIVGCEGSRVCKLASSCQVRLVDGALSRSGCYVSPSELTPAHRPCTNEEASRIWSFPWCP